MCSLFPLEAPIAHGFENGLKRPALLRETVGGMFGAIGRCHLLHDAADEKSLQAVGQEVRRDLLGGGTHLLESLRTEKQIPDHQQRPSVSKNIQTGRQGTGGPAGVTRQSFFSGRHGSESKSNEKDLQSTTKLLLKCKQMKPSSSTSFLSRYGPWALVTGASSGLGRALALELAAAGFDLLLVSRHREALEALAQELSTRSSRLFVPVPADLATPDGLQTVLTAVESRDVGLLISAAGFGAAGAFLDSDLETETAMIEVNGRSTMVLAHELGRRLVKRGRGGMILFGSLLGFQGGPGSSHYAATKAYVQSLAEGLHRELKPFGVDVLAAAPGPVATGFAKRAGMTMTLSDCPEPVAREILGALGRRMSCTPGTVGKFLTWSLHTAPRFLRVRIMEQILRGLTAPQTRS